MKIVVLAADGSQLCQRKQLVAGFKALGHEPIVDYTDPDTSFVFVGNSPYSSYLDLARSGQRKVIFNVLDLCPHCADHADIVARLRDQLPLAAKVTTISRTVAAELAEKCGIRAEVIYYPMKPVRFTGERKCPQFKVLCAGRLRDPNKGMAQAVMALVRAGFNESEVAMVGPEFPGWGTNMGVISDEKLNDLYNSVDYVVSLAREEGIGLVPIEGSICGAIPIVLPTLSTYNEFWADSPMGIHYQTLHSPDAIATLLRAIENDPEWKGKLKQEMCAYGERVFCPLFDPVEVAKRILTVAL